ncbi:hypothetical protein Cni_G24866 [Canna indica]|uniref:Uncharacterized protein n=1 Tax=Canna indica TaxID=4628 RepID=A0AAQ3KWM8_9LILI|nr:hypothetical protein Cni_G24866 [Canna indica]
MNPTKERDRTQLLARSRLRVSLLNVDPFLLRMIGGSGASLRRRRTTKEEDGVEEVNSDCSCESKTATTTERLQRSSPAILRLLQSLGRSNSGSVDDEREHVVFINPFNRAVIVQTSIDANQSHAQAETNGRGGVGVAFRDYFLLLQQLAENDLSRYSTLPVRKEAVEVMPIVKVESSRFQLLVDETKVPNADGNGDSNRAEEGDSGNGGVMPIREDALTK